MSRKLRIPKTQAPQLTETELWILSEGVYPKPAEVDEWEAFQLSYPTVTWPASRELWQRAEETILAAWIRERPGRRPQWWWIFSAPRMAEAEVEAGGWSECYFDRQLPDPRRRQGGTGEPAYEHLAVVPRLNHGIPEDWITAGEVEEHQLDAAAAVNPADPPRYESQASYLKRHGLLTPGEARRLKPADFEPEVVLPESEDMTEQ